MQIFIYMHFRSHVLVGSKGQVILVHAIKLYDVYSTKNIIQVIVVTWGGGDKGVIAPLPLFQYFFNLGIVYLVTELNNGKYKIDRKKEMKNLS
jgi:hypothetical protein